jgi:hypothetical protein
VATRLCSDLAVQRPGCAATQLRGDPAVTTLRGFAEKTLSDLSRFKQSCMKVQSILIISAL